MVGSRYGRRLPLAALAAVALLLGWPRAAGAQQARLLLDIAVGAEPGSGDPRYPLVQVGKKAYFSATDRDHGRELWASDGTAEGTSRVTDLAPGATSSDPDAPVVLRDSLYFFAKDAAGVQGLWQTNGSPASTRLISSLGEGRSVWSSCVAVAGDLLYFIAVDAAQSVALWRSDGTLGPPTLVLDLGSVLDVASIDMVAVGASLVVAVHGLDANSTTTLWGTRGTPSTTVKLKETAPWVRELVPVGDRAFFTVDDESGEESGLWLTDATELGTRQVSHFTFDYGDGSGVFNLTSSGDLLYFGANYRVWVSDGTLEGTSLLSGLNPEAMVAAGARLYVVGRFAAGDSGCDLHALDATGERSTALDACPWAEAAIGDQLVVVLTRPDAYEVLRSDATPEGTVLLRSFPRFDRAGAELYGPQVIGRGNDGRLFLRAFTHESGWELWQTDGTEAGTLQVSDLDPVTVRASSNPSIRGFASGGRRYFVADDGVRGSGLYVTDAAGTRRLDLTTHPEGMRQALVRESKAGVFVFGYAGTEAMVHRLDADVPQLLWQTTTPGVGCSCVTDRYAYIEDGQTVWRIDATGAVAVGQFDLYSPGCMAVGSTAVYITTADGGSYTLSSVAEEAAELVPFAQHTAETVYPLTVIGDRFFYQVRVPSGAGSTLEVYEWQAGAAAATRRPELDAPSRVHLMPVGDRIAVVQDGVSGSTCTVWDEAFREGTPILTSTVALSGFPMDGKVYFLEGALGEPTPTSRYALWRSDGTAEGTHRIAEGLKGVYSLTALPNGGGVIFSDGAEMWTCELDEDAATPFRPDGLRTAFDNPSDFIRTGNRVLFAADDPEHGRELWVLEYEPAPADGCAAGGAPGAGGGPGRTWPRASWLAVLGVAALWRLAVRRRIRGRREEPCPVARRPS